MKSEAIALLNEQNFGVLGTINEDGSPWTTALHFASDDSYLYWFSPEITIHSQNVVRDGRASFTVFSPDKSEGLKSVFIQGKAEELSGEDDAHARKVVKARFGEALAIVDISRAYRLPIGVLSEEKSAGKLCYFYN